MGQNGSKGAKLGQYEPKWDTNYKKGYKVQAILKKRHKKYIERKKGKKQKTHQNDDQNQLVKQVDRLVAEKLVY